MQSQGNHNSLSFFVWDDTLRYSAVSSASILCISVIDVEIAYSLFFSLRRRDDYFLYLSRKRRDILVA